MSPLKRELIRRKISSMSGSGEASCLCASGKSLKAFDQTVIEIMVFPDKTLCGQLSG
jgi:hypothetical protein